MSENKPTPSDDKVAWPVNDAGDNVAYLKSVPVEDVTSPEFRQRMIDEGYYGVKK